jgi:predicted NUDIX family NTP pyrophosphohydrolase
MAKKSAGILLFRHDKHELECFLIHPGGPFFKNKDKGVWSIPKGELDESEEPLAAAIREFEEETGKRVEGPFVPLTPVKQKGGKLVCAWAAKGAFDPATLKCNTFRMEWPPKSGKFGEFPEADRGEWFTLEVASEKIIPGQLPLLKELEALVSG